MPCLFVVRVLFRFHKFYSGHSLFDGYPIRGSMRNSKEPHVLEHFFQKHNVGNQELISMGFHCNAFFVARVLFRFHKFHEDFEFTDEQ